MLATHPDRPAMTGGQTKTRQRMGARRKKPERAIAEALVAGEDEGSRRDKLRLGRWSESALVRPDQQGSADCAQPRRGGG